MAVYCVGRHRREIKVSVHAMLLWCLSVFLTALYVQCVKISELIKSVKILYEKSSCLKIHVLLLNAENI